MEAVAQDNAAPELPPELQIGAAANDNAVPAPIAAEPAAAPEAGPVAEAPVAEAPVTDALAEAPKDASRS